ncbi:MAG: hypothetical protein U9O98_00890, partial [Asgard group archaeon]|nr:hypothetical protein [Asgard group archaeon]
MKIFIQEYLTGGGENTQPLNRHLLIEGFGMLRTLIKVFQKRGWEVITTLDKRLKFLKPFLLADKIREI